MRSNNPMLSRLSKTARGLSVSTDEGTMTVTGAASKALVLLGLAIFSASLVWWRIAQGHPEIALPAIGFGALSGFALAMVGVFYPRTTPYTAPLYAVCEGLALGAISAAFNAESNGVAQQSVLLTFGVAAAVLVLYRMRLLQATSGFVRGLVSAMVGILLFYIGALVLSFFGVTVGYFTSSGSWWAIALNLVIVGVAALNLVLDFDLIERGERARAPKFMEWYGALSLLLTLVWLYLELLRLVQRVHGDD